MVEHPPLTARELEVLKLIACGYTDKEVARILKIADNTIYRHVVNIRNKLNAVNRCHAIYLAATAGDLPPKLLL